MAAWFYIIGVDVQEFQRKFQETLLNHQPIIDEVSWLCIEKNIVHVYGWVDKYFVALYIKIYNACWIIIIYNIYYLPDQF